MKPHPLPRKPHKRKPSIRAKRLRAQACEALIISPRLSDLYRLYNLLI